ENRPSSALSLKPREIARFPAARYASGVDIDIERIQQAVTDRLGADPSVATVYLFGSRARGTARPHSDVDLGLLYRGAAPQTLLEQPYDAQAQLSRELGVPVDIVVLNTAPVDLIHRVLRDGQLLIESDRSARIAFEVDARNRYFDLLPTLR